MGNKVMSVREAARWRVAAEVAEVLAAAALGLGVALRVAAWPFSVVLPLLLAALASFAVASGCRWVTPPRVKRKRRRKAPKPDERVARPGETLVEHAGPRPVADVPRQEAREDIVNLSAPTDLRRPAASGA